MEVSQMKTATTGEMRKVIDPPTLRFVWKIANFSRLNTQKYYSEVFTVGEFKWRVLLFPKGNNVDHLSMYLDVADSGSLPSGWSRHAQIGLSIVNQMHSKNTLRKDYQHQFNARESDWGFTSFMPLSDLCDPSRGYLVNDMCIVEAEVTVHKYAHPELPEKQQMKEVAQRKAATAGGDRNVEEPPTLGFVWRIENFSKLETKKHYSEVFTVGEYKWRVLLFPKGNNKDHLSIYLDVADSGSLPRGWSRDAQFSLSIVNQIHSKNTVRKDTQHQFNAGESDWGFTSFMPLSDLCDPSRGYLVNDTCVVEAEVTAHKPPCQIIGSTGDQLQNYHNHNHHPEKIEPELARHAPAQNPVIVGGTKQSSTLTEIDAIVSAIVGLDGIKLQLSKWIKGLVLHNKRMDLGLKFGSRKALHMAFLGNPGTGKTMVARLLGKVLHKLGLVSTDKVTEVQRTDLVAEYVGQTGVKTRLKIKEASGGILFVDEAYRLVPPNMPKDFGVEALEEIMSAMDSGDIIAIFAGYSEEMERVISANAGFSRRVNKFFYFDDYTPRDIATILHSKINAQKEDTFIYGFRLHPDCTIEAIASLIEENIPNEQLKKLNGGLVDPLLINSLENLDLRLDVDCMDLDTLTTITMEDLKEGLKSIASSKKKGPYR